MSETIRVVSSTPEVEPTPVGYVEAMTEAAALGWVWRPGTPDRLKVELQLDGNTVAEAVADMLRDDLARSGIGDGRHAFMLPIPPELAGRRTELRVAAIPADGSPVFLAPPADPARDRLGQLQRGVEMLMGSQRLLHRNLQAALLQQGPSPTQLLTEIAATQAKLQETLDTVELFAVRLEQALVTREPAATAARVPKLLGAAVGIAGLALAVALIALGRIVLGG